MGDCGLNATDDVSVSIVFAICIATFAVYDVCMSSCKLSSLFPRRIDVSYGVPYLNSIAVGRDVAPSFVSSFCPVWDVSRKRHFRAHVLVGRSIRYRRVYGQVRCATGTASLVDRRSSAIVVGGGPAGFFAAIHFALTARHLGTVSPKVTILEATRHVLQKVRISGGGRCNVTNAVHRDNPRLFALNYPPGRGRREMVSPLHAWSAQDTINWFEDQGVSLKVEPSGKVFPVSDSSADIIDALVNAARTVGVCVESRKRVTAVKLVHPDKESVSRETAARFAVAVNGESVERFCEAVCICTGSAWMAHDWALALNHSLVPLVPSLFTFKVKDDPRLTGLAGVSVSDVVAKLVVPVAGNVDNKKQPPVKETKHATASLQRLEHRGPILVTHWGLSGPAILQLSSLGARVLHDLNYHADCVVDFVPVHSYNEKLEILKSARTRFAHRSICKHSPFASGVLPNRMWRSLILHAGCEPDAQWSNASNRQLVAITDAIHRSSFRVTGKGEFKDEFVTAGGVAISNISTKTFESKIVPGLFFAGEVVNIDGITGGFNFQNAWSSGYLAGTAMAHLLCSNN